MPAVVWQGCGLQWPSPMPISVIEFLPRRITSADSCLNQMGHGRNSKESALMKQLRYKAVEPKTLYSP